jgi:hypothetical protein
MTSIGDWEPGMDAGPRFSSIGLETIRAHRFDHTANRAPRVRNVSTTGSQLFLLHICAI